MEKFLEKIQSEIESKMLACIKGESIIKPFSKIYNEVREKILQEKEDTIINLNNMNNPHMIYSKGEASIYDAVVKQFLKEHPELKKENEEKE